MVAARRCCTGGAGRCCRVDGGRRRGESGKVQPWRRGELRTTAPGAAAAMTEATSGGARSCNRSDLELQPWRRPGAMTSMMLEPTSFFAGTGDRRCYNRGSKMLEPTATAFSRWGTGFLKSFNHVLGSCNRMHESCKPSTPELQPERLRARALGVVADGDVCWTGDDKCFNDGRLKPAARSGERHQWRGRCWP
ncbi:hypothetical protein VPH35_139233 [Triticum aestivum]